MMMGSIRLYCEREGALPKLRGPKKKTSNYATSPLCWFLMLLMVYRPAIVYPHIKELLALYSRFTHPLNKDKAQKGAASVFCKIITTSFYAIGQWNTSSKFIKEKIIDQGVPFETDYAEKSWSFISTIAENVHHETFEQLVKEMLSPLEELTLKNSINISRLLRSGIHAEIASKFYLEKVIDAMDPRDNKKDVKASALLANMSFSRLRHTKIFWDNLPTLLVRFSSHYRQNLDQGRVIDLVVNILEYLPRSPEEAKTYPESAIETMEMLPEWLLEFSQMFFNSIRHNGKLQCKEAAYYVRQIVLYFAYSGEWMDLGEMTMDLLKNFLELTRESMPESHESQKIIYDILSTVASAPLPDSEGNVSNNYVVADFILPHFLDNLKEQDFDHDVDLWYFSLFSAVVAAAPGVCVARYYDSVIEVIEMAMDAPESNAKEQLNRSARDLKVRLCYVLTRPFLRCNAPWNRPTRVFGTEKTRGQYVIDTCSVYDEHVHIIERHFNMLLSAFDELEKFTEIEAMDEDSSKSSHFSVSQIKLLRKALIKSELDSSNLYLWMFDLEDTYESVTDKYGKIEDVISPFGTGKSYTEIIYHLSTPELRNIVQPVLNRQKQLFDQIPSLKEPLQSLPLRLLRIYENLSKKIAMDDLETFEELDRALSVLVLNLTVTVPPSLPWLDKRDPFSILKIVETFYSASEMRDALYDDIPLGHKKHLNYLKQLHDTHGIIQNFEEVSYQRLVWLSRFREPMLDLFLQILQRSFWVRNAICLDSIARYFAQMLSHEDSDAFLRVIISITHKRVTGNELFDWSEIPEKQQYFAKRVYDVLSVLPDDVDNDAVIEHGVTCAFSLARVPSSWRIMGEILCHCHDYANALEDRGRGLVIQDLIEKLCQNVMLTEIPIPPHSEDQAESRVKCLSWALEKADSLKDPGTRVQLLLSFFLIRVLGKAPCGDVRYISLIRSNLQSTSIALKRVGLLMITRLYSTLDTHNEIVKSSWERSGYCNEQLHNLRTSSIEGAFDESVLSLEFLTSILKAVESVPDMLSKGFAQTVFSMIPTGEILQAKRIAWKVNVFRSLFLRFGMSLWEPFSKAIKLYQDGSSTPLGEEENGASIGENLAAQAARLLGINPKQISAATTTNGTGTAFTLKVTAPATTNVDAVTDMFSNVDLNVSQEEEAKIPVVAFEALIGSVLGIQKCISDGALTIINHDSENNEKPDQKFIEDSVYESFWENAEGLFNKIWADMSSKKRSSYMAIIGSMKQLPAPIMDRLLDQLCSRLEHKREKPITTAREAMIWSSLNVFIVLAWSNCENNPERVKTIVDFIIRRIYPLFKQELPFEFDIVRQSAVMVVKSTLDYCVALDYIRYPSINQQLEPLKTEFDSVLAYWVNMCKTAPSTSEEGSSEVGTPEVDMIDEDGTNDNRVADEEDIELAFDSTSHQQISEHDTEALLIDVVDENVSSESTKVNAVGADLTAQKTQQYAIEAFLAFAKNCVGICKLFAPYVYDVALLAMEHIREDSVRVQARQALQVISGATFQSYPEHVEHYPSSITYTSVESHAQRVWDSIHPYTKVHSRRVAACAIDAAGLFYFHNFLLLPVALRKDIRHLIEDSLESDLAEVRLHGVSALMRIMVTLSEHDFALMGRKYVKRAMKQKRKSSKTIDGETKTQPLLSGVLGLSAVVGSTPFALNEVIKDSVNCLTFLAQSPCDIGKEAKITVNNFKKTHVDTWHEMPDWFTGEEWERLCGVLPAQHYYS
eukprot:TRINITY_DN28_c0_g2_i1.p1 TRINITY_DN28_c0_g2~~TRINITY_DN28_c0_g2_i1.p1  ORF type:complete len:2016 (-),score=561.66 TRINITY_DN28_c0_g2_i1:189-5411(-)